VPGSGTFRESDPSEAVDLVDRKLLHGVLRAFRRVDGVSIRPVQEGLEGLSRKERSAARRAVPHVWIGRPRWYRRSVTVNVWGVDGDTVAGTLAGAGFDAPESHVGVGGTCTFRFPNDVAADELVRFCLSALQALGARPAGGRWEYSQTVEVDTTGPAGS
jgi:hypothetical protein